MVDQTAPVMITGATGFLGSWIASNLASKGVPVIATDITDDQSRLKALMPEIPAGMVTTLICDVTDPVAVETLVAENKPSAIIHLAALQIPHCRAHPIAGARVNIIGHLNIFEVARKHDVRRIIYTSSIAAKPRGPQNAPANLYGVFKKTDEEIARIYWSDYGISSLGLRPHIVYGVGRDEGETSAITAAIRAAALGETYTLPFRTRSCFQYAGEVAEMFTRAAGANWEGALLSDLTNEVLSTNDILQAIKAVVPGSDIRGSDQDRISPTEGFEVAPLKMVIGDWPATPIVEGVRQTVELYRRIQATEARPAL